MKRRLEKSSSKRPPEGREGAVWVGDEDESSSSSAPSSPYLISVPSSPGEKEEYGDDDDDDDDDDEEEEEEEEFEERSDRKKGKVRRAKVLGGGTGGVKREDNSQAQIQRPKKSIASIFATMAPSKPQLRPAGGGIDASPNGRKARAAAQRESDMNFTISDSPPSQSSRSTNFFQKRKGVSSPRRTKIMGMGPLPTLSGRDALPKAPQISPRHPPSTIKGENGASASQSSKSGPTSSKDLWTTRYSPRDCSELAVHVKKVEAARAWLAGALSTPGSWPRLLALVGPSGCGKTALIRALASEANLEVCEWQDTSGLGQGKYRSPEERLVFSSSWDGSGANELNSGSQLSQFREFLGLTRFVSLAIAGESQRRRKGAKITIIEDMPTVSKGDRGTSEADLRQVLSSFARSTRNPAVLIIGTDDSPNTAVERLVGADAIDRGLIQILPMNAIAATNLRKCLRRIAEQEGLPNYDDVIEEVITECRGDVRHAVLSLQVLSQGIPREAPVKGPKSGKKKKSTGARASSRVSPTLPAGTSSRDHFLSTFQALGRLLYPKKMDEESNTRNPESAIYSSSMTEERAATFLQYHCPGFFTEISQLYSSLDAFSDADLFAAAAFDPSRGRDSMGQPQSSYPLCYTASIASRAVHAHNANPAPSTFRPFGAPRWHELQQQRSTTTQHLNAFIHERWLQDGEVWTQSRHIREDIFKFVVPVARQITGVHAMDVALRDLWQQSSLSTNLIPNFDGGEEGPNPVPGKEEEDTLDED